jgi:hypothetical protein
MPRKLMRADGVTVLGSGTVEPVTDLVTALGG